MIADLLAAIGDWSVAEWLRGSFYVYPLVNLAHIVGFILLVGGILPTDLRLLGAFSRVPVAFFARVLEPMAAIGLVLAVGAGFLLFTVNPLDYVANVPFLIKMGLVAFGIANALSQRFGAGWRLAVAEDVIPRRMKVQAALSIAIWLSALAAGRFIAFIP